MRIGARVVDTLVGSVIGAIVETIKSMAFVAATKSAPPAARLDGGIVFSLLGPIVYQAICESVGATSVGKLVFGMQVRNESLGRCSFGAALGRNFGLYFDLLFCGLPGLRAMQKSPLEAALGRSLGAHVRRPRAERSAAGKREARDWYRRRARRTHRRYGNRGGLVSLLTGRRVKASRR